MNLDETRSENLFSYGTLQDQPVQLATFGRVLDGTPDVLVGYQLEMVTTRDEDFVIKSGAAEHRNLRYTGLASDVVEGTVFKLTKKEIEEADGYEPWDYKRRQVELKSGTQAWIYLQTQ